MNSTNLFYIVLSNVYKANRNGPRNLFVLKKEPKIVVESVGFRFRFVGVRHSCLLDILLRGGRSGDVDDQCSDLLHGSLETR